MTCYGHVLGVGFVNSDGVLGRLSPVCVSKILSQHIDIEWMSKIHIHIDWKVHR